MDAVLIYRDRSDDRFYDASTREMNGGPDKMIGYLSGFSSFWRPSKEKDVTRARAGSPHNVTAPLRARCPSPSDAWPTRNSYNRAGFQRCWPPLPYVGRLEVRQ
jgi:hypothetical protein